MKTIILTSYFSFLSAGLLSAQEVAPFTANIGGGITQTVGLTGRNLDNGWNLQGAVGFNLNAYLGAVVEAEYNDLGITGAAANNLGFGSGSVRVFSATIDPVVRLRPRGRFDPYIIGGGGMYRRMEQFNAPTGFAPSGYNPFFGFDTPGVSAFGMNTTYSVNRPGYNIGVGVDFRTKWRTKIYAEARYNHIFMPAGEHTDFLPITFGVRW
jgi:hypothetical protein